MKFVDTAVSTQTFTVRSNIQNIDLARFYEHIKVEPAEPVVIKKTDMRSCLQSKIVSRQTTQCTRLRSTVIRNNTKRPSVCNKTKTKTLVTDLDESGVKTKDLDNNLPHKIIQVKYQTLKKGKEPESIIRTRKRKNNIPTPSSQPVSKRNFLNCITMVVFVGKKINIKLFKNGVFQLTGCKHIQHVISCINIIRSELLNTRKYTVYSEQQTGQRPAAIEDCTGQKPTEIEDCNHKLQKSDVTSPPDCFSFLNNDQDLVVYIKSAMRNIDFDLGFKINRVVFTQRLMELFNDDNNIIVPDAVGNKMDMKIKIRLTTHEIENLPVTKITYPSRKTELISYKQCIDTIEQHNKKLANKFKDKFISIFVFQNGKVLLSAADDTVQEIYYNWFIQVVRTLESEITPQKQERKTFLVNRKIPLA